MNLFQKLIALAIVLSTSSAFAGIGKEWYPKHPDPRLTPGSYCNGNQPTDRRGRPSTCERNVDGGDKWDVIREYNQRLGYDINPGNRTQFKIDHLIPLCFGGGNDKENLWPQHQTVYVITDDIEHIGCEKLRGGRISQIKVIELLLSAKRDHSKAEQVLSYLKGL